VSPRRFKLEHGQPLEQAHSWFHRWVRQLQLHGRHGERRRRITKLKVSPRQPRPGFDSGLDIAGAVADIHGLLE
jgi:hypothetical protein